MALTLAFNFSQSSDCETFYVHDVTANYGSGGNPAASAITSTLITLTDSSGNAFTYSDYLPTQGEIGLIWGNFTQTASEDDTEDCGCCGCASTENELAPDGCWSLNYQIFIDEVSQASVGENLLFYCQVRNSIFDLIAGSCDDCCDSAKQIAIAELRNDYDIFIITYNKLENCDCSERQLARLNKKISKIENDCDGC